MHTINTLEPNAWMHKVCMNLLVCTSLCFLSYFSFQQVFALGHGIQKAQYLSTNERYRNCVSTVNALMMELQECGIQIYGEKFWGTASIQSKALWSLCRYSIALTHMDGWTEKWKQAAWKAFLYRPQLWFFGFWGWSLFAHHSEALLTQVCTLIPRHSRFSLHKKEPGYVLVTLTVFGG